MSRKLVLFMVFFLLAVSPLIFFGCKKKALPYEPNNDVGNNPPAGNLVWITSITPFGPSIAVDTLFIITFSDFMNEATVSSGNITVWNVANNSQVPITVVYEKETKKAYVSPVDSFPDDIGLLLEITRSVQDRSGNFIDGDVDGVDDGTPYDEELASFYTGGGIAYWSRTRIYPPIISFVSPDTMDGVSVNTTFQVGFSPGVNPMDTLTLTPSNFSLFEASTGNTITLELVNRNGFQVVLQPQGGAPLDSATQYTFRILGGSRIKAMPDTTGGVINDYLLILDTDGDGPEANEPNIDINFVTDGDTLNDAEAPTVTSWPSGLITGPDFSVTFSEEMDTGTFTSTNIRVYRTIDMASLTGSIVPFSDKKGFRFTLENAVPGIGYTLFISRRVTDDSPNRWKLDNDGNGVGGEVTDDFTSFFTYF